MNRLIPVFLALASAAFSAGCSSFDFWRGTYEGARSHDAAVNPMTPGTVRQTLPPYEDYERERNRARGGNPSIQGQ